MWGAGGAPPPPAVKPGGIPGCLKAAIIIGVLLIVLLIVVFVALGSLLSGFLGLGGGLGEGDDGGFANCSFMSDDEARAILGGSADAIELSGIADLSIGLIIDKRALADAPDCWITEGTEAYIARVARYDGVDAATVFAQERQAAQPVTEDQGGGISVTREGYDAGDAPGVGDEAFCTGISPAIMAGVLVRQGNTVVYASVGPPEEEDRIVPDMVPMENGVIGAPGLCAIAQELARAALN